MSTALPRLEARPHRVLACMLCQKRKIKCDRKFPCHHCVTSGAQCVPGTQAQRERKRRFPERELLLRLRKYEDLLTQHNIKFEPLHTDRGRGSESQQEDTRSTVHSMEATFSPPQYSATSAVVNPNLLGKADETLQPKSQDHQDLDEDSDASHDDDDVFAVAAKKVWNQIFSNDHIIFGQRDPDVDISTLHPEPVQIFRLWQLYIDNVNPLLKVTHTPSLQGRIIEAAGDIPNIQPNLGALMFSIYCMSITSLTTDECQSIFGSSKESLLAIYQMGCQQALLNGGFLRCDDRDSLTALYLYLMSLRPSTIPRSLSSMLGIAIRIAQRMGLNSETALAECTILEAEMRRRLWWSLVLFDTRIGEMALPKCATQSTLNPFWNCRIPMNVSDSDLRVEMKEPPKVQGKTAEALFVVVRSHLGDFIRQNMFHLDFYNPALEAFAKKSQDDPVTEDSQLAKLEELIEEEYFRFCDPENPLHFFTIWMSRTYIAKRRLMRHNSRYYISTHQTESQRNTTISCACHLLECDTKIMASPLTKRFHWMAHFYFPLPAYMHIVHILVRRPVGDQAERAWQVMSDNYDCRFSSVREKINSPFFKTFFKIISQAWEAREAASARIGRPLVKPKIVSSVEHTMAQMAQPARDSPATTQSSMDLVINDFAMTMSMGLSDHSLPPDMTGQESHPVTEPVPYSHIPDVPPLDLDLDRLDWSAMDWDYMNGALSGGFEF
ncbi:hypothetical protein PVAG01_07656 [Phlyctema vagabunda]|uniref:Zn(2)-C6 fungal-type domain-containing protein n=1 Tax=Phlyctema vagabunda TaxID=108571 RepID=A0ABR4PD21_9HELO